MDEIDTRPTAATRLEVPVLIVGAGPAGLVTAISLARQGVRSLVVERHPSTSIFPRATGVSTRSMEIFRSFGIDEEVRRGGWGIVPRQATVRWLGDPEPVEGALGFPDADVAAAVSPTTATVSPQDHLEPVLVDHYRSLGMGEIRFSTELVFFEGEADGVTATLRDRIDGTVVTVRSRYLVGADGHRSTVRDALGIPMEGPDDLGQFISILFRADLSTVLGDDVYGLYVIGGDAGPPTVLVPSGADDRFVFAIPLLPGMDAAATAAAFPPERCIALIRDAARRPDLDVEILASNAFAFSAQVASRLRDGRVILVGDAAHRMTPRGGRGMNTAIADAYDLGWKLAWTVRGLATEALVESYEIERGPVGRRNVALSMVPGEGGGTDDGLLEDLGAVVRSAVIVDDGSSEPASAAGADPSYWPDARPGARAPHAWLSIGEERLSTLDLFGRELVLMVAGDAGSWRTAAASVAESMPGPAVRIRSVGRWLRDTDGTFAETYGLSDGGAVLVRPDGVVAWRMRSAPTDMRRALAAAVAVATGRGSDADRDVLSGVVSIAGAHEEAA
ncbi:MAG: 2,4-dichlorophenol 6-monooxygenase [Chloroflexota bacterium]|jgi:2-polyprenyl-6-methoxyphenol hydroxylase-like FAD-dependent oxidoreductase|nr:2,4-dichlorophenol 6-monooxygenase [Chloroflexota bacterium]